MHPRHIALLETRGGSDRREMLFVLSVGFTAQGLRVEGLTCHIPEGKRDHENRSSGLEEPSQTHRGLGKASRLSTLLRELGIDDHRCSLTLFFCIQHSESDGAAPGSTMLDFQAA